MHDSYLSSFTPSIMLPETLEAIFVQREKLVEDLIAGVKESATTQNKHYRLLVGMRGIGKTHTIALLYHRLKNEVDLKDKLLIAWLKEEEWGVSSWLDLQVRILRALKNLYPEEYRDKLAADVEALYQLSPEEATARGDIILKEFIGKRTLLILTENLDEIFKGLGDTGQKKFRAYLQNNSFITIVATSQSLSNDLTSKKRAFYGFFNINNLNKLSLDEATNLLIKIAQLQEDGELAKFIRSQTGQDRIKAIHHLAGGNHRVYIIFSQFLTRDSLDDLVKPVMQTLDELTPYYQARMQWLSPQQRKIVELLCDRASAIPVKEIAQRCFISHQTTSSQLKDLLTKGYVVKQTKGRESFYELQEPLMRICLETKKQRGEPIKLFVDFLRIWYTDDELKLRLQQLSNNCVEKKYILKALELKSFLPQISSSKNNKDLDFLIAKGIEEYKQKKYSNALPFFDLILQSHKIKDAYKIELFRVASLVELNMHQEALKSLDELLIKKSNDNKLWFIHGLILRGLGRNQEAIISYETSIKIDSNNYLAWLNRGYALNALDRNEEAIQSFNKAIKINPNDERAWIILAGTQTWINRNEEAVQSFRKVLTIRSNDKTHLDDDCIWDMYGIALLNSGKYEEAIQSFNKVISINPNHHSVWFYLGAGLFLVNDWNEGFTAFKNGFAIYENEEFENEEEFDFGDTKAITWIIFVSNQDRETWQDRINTLVGLYDRYQAVSSLGKGITENIPNLLSEMVSNKAARTWLEVWQEVGGDKPGLEIPLRWLKTAVEYKETQGDSKVLLQLPKEERDLFVTLLEDIEE